MVRDRHKKTLKLRPEALLSGRKRHTSFFDSASSRLRFFGCVYPIDKVPSRYRVEIAPLSLRLRHSRERFVQLERYHGKTTGASLSSGKPRRKTLDSALACLRLFRGIDPANEISTRDRRKVYPLRPRHRSSGENLAKIRRRSRLRFSSNWLSVCLVHGFNVSQLFGNCRSPTIEPFGSLTLATSSP